MLLYFTEHQGDVDNAEFLQIRGYIKKTDQQKNQTKLRNFW
jgi:hypothetical protein